VDWEVHRLSLSLARRKKEGVASSAGSVVLSREHRELVADRGDEQRANS